MGRDGPKDPEGHGTGTGLLLGDNLPILRALADDPDVAGKVALAYLDPPFNTGGRFTAGAASGGRGRAGEPTWRDDMDRGAYLEWMTDRLKATKALLAPNGSLFLHVDPRVSHYLKVALDGIFGLRAFVNEIVWRYRSGGRSTRRYAAKHDVILWYANGPGWAFHPGDVAVRAERRNHMRRSLDEAGNAIRVIRSNGREYRYPECAIAPPCDVWDDISHLNQRDPERTGYPTQKPLALLERIIAGSSSPGDLVLDPFCGSGTTLVAARRLGRRWLGIDSSPLAVQLCQKRLDGG